MKEFTRGSLALFSLYWVVFAGCTALGYVSQAIFQALTGRCLVSCDAGLFDVGLAVGALAISLILVLIIIFALGLMLSPPAKDNGWSNPW